MLDSAGPDLLKAEPGDPAARALMAAGLIVPASASSAQAGEPAAYYRTAPAHQASFARGDWGGASTQMLCFGKRSVGATTLDVSGADTRVRYDFSLVDAPSWTRDPAMKAQFPLIAGALLTRYAGEEVIPVQQDGQLDLALLKPMADHPLVRSGAAFVTR